MDSHAHSHELPLAGDATEDGCCGASSGCGPDASSPPCGQAAGGGAGAEVETLIDRFIEEQANPTAAERFAREHDDDLLPAASYYRSLMPATPPGDGQQYAFDVDLDVCTGCKACVTACRSLNGLDSDESWRSVGLLVGETGGGEPLQQHVTTACHHCVEPGCLEGCPVDAYEKDPDTGIVSHLSDQCIGCGYCILMCPYEVPRFDRGRGIVRKCDMCADRLAEGEAPACVQACPTEAISVQVVDVAEAQKAAVEERWPIVAPDPAMTVPTTTYRTERDLSSAESADLRAVAPSHPHPPLTVMLVLTQVAVGAHLVNLLVHTPAVGSLVALLTAVVAMGASVAHLGRPRYAYRAVIGLRHSWLSREIVAFGAFVGLASLDAGGQLITAGTLDLPLSAGGLSVPTHSWVTTGLSAVTAAAGVAAVACSAMVYAATGKRWWRARTVSIRFGLTTLAGGLAVVLAIVLTNAWITGTAAGHLPGQLALVLAATVAVKLGVEASLLRHATGPVSHELTRTVRLLTGTLRKSSVWRLGLGLVGGVALPLTIALALTDDPRAAGEATVAAWTAAGALTAGELIERWQFFTAASARRMPGGMR